jgi:predicted AlkP superfamily pyrophosphatase or phosphodiesterase
VRLISTLFTSSWLLAAPMPKKPSPKLVVVISVDQLSADLTKREEPHFKAGFRRLLREGVNFTQAYHEHAFTETGPGHSVLLSGRHPMHTGITENDWLDRETGHSIYCVQDINARVLGKKSGNASPRLFKGTTLGGWMKEASEKNRAFAIAGKDRAAILMAGPRADGVYWFETSVGFTTSSFYALELPLWLKDWNAQALTQEKAQTRIWNAPKPRFDLLGQYSIDDCSYRLGLPRLIHRQGEALDSAWFRLFRASPFFDALTLEATRKLIAAQKIGKGEGVDLLAIGLSATDFVGHAYGTEGEEMSDHLRRLDGMLGSFLDWLHRWQPHAVIVLTADHGGWDLPERFRDQHREPAERVSAESFLQSINDSLQEKFKLARAPFRQVAEPKQLYFDEASLVGSGMTTVPFLNAAVAHLKSLPLVQEAATGKQLDAIEPLGDRSPAETSYLERLKLSYVPGRSGDILIAFKPRVIFAEGPMLATHGSPHDYDRRVPMIFWGVSKGRRVSQPVRTVDLAPTLAEILGIRPSEAIDGKVLRLK